MDLYEYFLRKIGFKICHISELLNHVSKLLNLKSFNLVGPKDPRDYSWDIHEFDDQIYVCYGVTKKSDVCKYVYDRLISNSYIFDKVYFNYPYSEKFKLTIKNLLKQLAEFPEKLTSKEEVDLLLAVNGLNLSEE